MPIYTSYYQVLVGILAGLAGQSQEELPCFLLLSISQVQQQNTLLSLEQPICCLQQLLKQFETLQP